MAEKILEIEREDDAVVVRFNRRCMPWGPLMTPVAGQHFRAATREVLLAMRNLIDAAVACSEAREQESQPVTKVNIQ